MAEEKYRAIYLERKCLHNELIELKGNIRVYCRVRPVLDFERTSGSCQIVVNTEDDKTIVDVKTDFNVA